MLPKDSTLLIVDDMKMIRTAMKRFLNQLGYNNFIEASDGEEALLKYAESKPQFIFMDIVMPGTTGYDALKIIRESDKKTPIVMLSSVAEENVIKDCEKEGILSYLIKPLTAEDGAQRLSQILSKV